MIEMKTWVGAGGVDCVSIFTTTGANIDNIDIGNSKTANNFPSEETHWMESIPT